MKRLVTALSALAVACADPAAPPPAAPTVYTVEPEHAAPGGGPSVGPSGIDTDPRAGIRGDDPRAPVLAARHAQGDQDGDGIPDDADKCPSEPEDKDGFEDEDGCPDPDNDHDGIPDDKDLCPNAPETFNGFEDEDGCPDRRP